MGFVRRFVLRVAAAGLILFALMWIDYFISNPKLVNPYYFRILMLSGIGIILAVSLNLVNGVTGQFSIGHAGFMVVGAYSSAALMVYGQGKILPVLANAPLWQQQAVMALGLTVGGLAAAAAGFVVGLPSLRLRGDYLAIVTLGFGEIIRVVIQNIDLVGGNSGFRQSVPPHPVYLIPKLTSFFWVALVALIVIVFSRNLLRSTKGLTFFSIREDEIAAEAMGVATPRLKVTAFVMSAFFAGVAGGLFAHYDTYIDPANYGFLRSIEIVTMVVLGGMGSISGSVLGAVILVSIPEWMRIWLSNQAVAKSLPPNVSVDILRQLLYALLLVVMMLTRPQGLLGPRELGLKRFFRRPPRKVRSAA